MPSVIDEPCQESRRVDYATAVFQSNSRDEQQEVFEFCLSLASGSFGSEWDWCERGHSPHFQRVFGHDLGLRIELTEVDDASGRNRGLTVMTLPGSAFYLQSTAEQALMLYKVVQAEGFRWFSRLDFQNTELEPEWPTERVYQAVVDQDVWVKGYRSWQPYGEVLQDGSCPGGRTLYFGSPRSERRARTYDKAAQVGWRTEGIRDEVQLRGEWAHSTTKLVAHALRSNLSSAAMVEALEGVVVKVLTQHLAYYDLNGTDPRADKNWTRKATPSDWYTKRIGKASEPIQKAPRERLNLATTVEYGIRQYGRYLAMHAAMYANESGLPLWDVWEGVLDKCWARLRREDLPFVFPGQSEAELEERWAELQQHQAQIAWEAEHAETDLLRKSPPTNRGSISSPEPS